MGDLLEKVIYHSAIMQQMRKEMESVIKTASPILFWGEPGNGMGFYVKAIHEASRTGKLLRKPCYELEAETLKEQLFGLYDQPGWLEEFDQGTIFFKRITQASLTTQETLLHLLETQSVDGRIEFNRKGATETLCVNVRFIFSMANDYNAAIQEKLLLREFGELIKKRGKLVRLPPLRERKEDLAAIAQNFIVECNRQLNRKVAGLDPKAQQVLRDYAWPGNIDELKRVINNIFLKHPDMLTITAEAIAEQIAESKIAGNQFNISLKGDEKFSGRILSQMLQIQKNDGSKLKLDTELLAAIQRVEDPKFAPPRLKHFVFKFKDGGQITGKILDTKMNVATSFDPNHQINPQNIDEIMLV